MSENDSNTDYIYYRAKGRSLEAVERLCSRNRNAKKNVSELLEDLHVLGINNPVSVQIYKSENGHPRPYCVANQIYEIPSAEGARDYIFQVPVDYKGGHIPPDGAEKLCAQESAYAEKYLSFGGGWADPVPLNAVLGFVPRTGAALPDDYDPKTAQHITAGSLASYDKETRYYRIPDAMMGKIRALFKTAEDGATAARKNPLSKFIVGADGKTLPQFQEFRDATYLVYRQVEPSKKLPIDRNLDLGQIKEARAQEEALKRMFSKDDDYDPDLLKTVQKVKCINAAEYEWVAADDFDVQIGITPPLDPPPALEELYCKTVFRAEGRSKAVLKEILRTEDELYRNQKRLEIILFGEPEISQSFNVAGHHFSTYRSQFHPVYEDGRVIGIRCDWTPLHPHYQGMENIEPPDNWEELDSHPGVYRPGKDAPQEQKDLFARLVYPDYRTFSDVFGGKPMIRVREAEGQYPRAYREWPFVHALRDAFYIEVPENHKREVFRPTDSARLSTKEYWYFRSGCGDMYEPHMMLRHEGVNLPADYQYTKPEAADPSTRYFLPAGRSEKILHDYKEEKKRVSKLRKDFVKAVGGSGSYGYTMGGGEITHVAFEGKVPENWVEKSSHRSSQIDEDGKIYDVTMYECVPDENTVEGRKIAQQMKSFPSEPENRDLQQRLGIDATVYLDSYRDKELFRIQAKNRRKKREEKGNLAPPDAIELPAAIIAWQQADETDKRCGIKPPPMPDALRQEMDAYSRQIKRPSNPVRSLDKRRKNSGGRKRG